MREPESLGVGRVPVREREEEFFGQWLLALSAELAALADGSVAASEAIRQRVERAISEVRPMVESAYRTSTDTADWDCDI